MKPVLITAGATRNPIDSMRYISAHATGRTGALLASRLVAHTRVTALCSPLAATQMPSAVKTEEFGGTIDLMGKMKTWIETNPRCLVVHSAAVGDYAVRQPSIESKISSGQATITLELEPTPKILDCIQNWSNAATVVSFKAAPPTTSQKQLAVVATNQLLRTNSDLVFANIIGNLQKHVILVGRDGIHAYATRQEAMDALALRLQTQILGEGLR